MNNPRKECFVRNKKLFLIFGISIAIIIVLIDLILFSTSLKQTGIGHGFSRFWKDDNGNNLINDNIDKQPVINEDGFSLQKQYIGGNNWEYTVIGQLPNPCHSVSVEAMVAESYPEQVTINVNIIEPDTDMMCIQVIQDFEYQGTFSASENASVVLRVNTATP